MLIGVTGGSGSGKSTVSSYLENRLDNAKCITVDDIMKKNIKVIYRKEIEKAFNLEELNPVSLFDSFESVNKWMDICKDNMNKELEEIINEYSKIYDYVIADYSLLPMMDVWNKCEMTINVSSRIDVKLDRLKQRLIVDNHIQKWTSDETIVNRMKCSALDEHGYKSDYTVYNNGTLEELLKQVDELIPKIKSS